MLLLREPPRVLDSPMEVDEVTAVLATQFFLALVVNHLRTHETVERATPTAASHFGLFVEKQLGSRTELELLLR